MADSIVAGWLSELDLAACISIFREEGIDSEALSCLTDDQLVQLGVKRMGDRTKVACLPTASPTSSCVTRTSLLVAKRLGQRGITLTSVPHLPRLLKARLPVTPTWPTPLTRPAFPSFEQRRWGSCPERARRRH